MASLLHFLSNSLIFLETVLGNCYWLITITTISLVLKLFIFTILAKHSLGTNSVKKPRLLLLIVLIGSMVSDSAWIIHLIHPFILDVLDSRIVICWSRIAWAFTAIQYQALALFIESLIAKKNPISLRHLTFLCISGLFSIFFVGVAFFDFNQWELFTVYKSQQAFSVYSLFILMPASLVMAIVHLKKMSLPRILRQQIKIFILALIVPHLLCDCLQMYPFNFSTGFVASSFAFVGISTMLLTIAIYYCTRKVMGLRFLNFNTHVESVPHYNFVDGFKVVLKQLSQTTSMKELEHITKGFFKEAFHLSSSKVQLYIRTPEDISYESSSTDFGQAELTTENFLETANEGVKQYIKESNILIHDEIAFSNFYDEHENSQTIIAFLEGIEADIFIPIYKQNNIIAYIIVERYAQENNKFYSNVERDEMLVFAQYVGNIINLLQQRNLEQMIQHEKELKEEVYNKHQEINQYKESIKSFLKNAKQKDIGIIFYKARRFTFGNQTAKELINTDLNKQPGHPTTKKLKNIGDLVKQYNTPQTGFITDSTGKKLIVCAVSHLEQQSVIIMVHYPEVSDIIKKQIDLLQDPTKWDYLLYLETTKSGHLINQLIPGSGETLLNFKIDIMRAALATKATLLEMPEKDLLPTVEILHHVSLRESLHVLKLTRASKNYDIAIKLFGINPIFGMTHNKPLLEKVGSADTIFIQNIHFLSLEAQQYLAELIKYGFYRIFKSDKKIPCDVRIICSTNQNLQPLVQEGKFSPILFNELKKTTIAMPSLLTLPEQEVSELAEGFTQQAIQNKSVKELLELSNKDKTKLVHNRPVSLFDFKCKVQSILKQKSQKNHLYEEAAFDPAYTISDPELVEAARLGKHALRDPKTMALLWNKFEKNQNRIADFLGVNRSSVNRRCKQYNLQ